MSDRKKDHIDLAFKARTTLETIDSRFDYEPILGGHPSELLQPFEFLGKTMQAPIWISSMTGGTGPARHINQNLAMAMGGKAFLVFTGDVDAVRYSMEAGVEVVSRRGLLVNEVVIPDPRPELFQTLI